MSSRSNDAKVELRPVGWVRNEVEEKPADGVWEELVSEIEIDEAVAPALEGIEEFSHIIVLFWIDRRDPSDRPLQVHPQGRQDLPLKGVFATRSPARPNPVGLTVVKLLERDGRVLRVLGLDALNGTPVLDIKPYLVRGDSVPDASIPEWLRTLWGLRSS